MTSNWYSHRGTAWKSGLSLLTAMVLSLTALMAWPATALAREGTATASSIQPYLDGVADNINEFILDNGMKFVVLERPQAPVVSFMLYADVGADNEVLTWKPLLNMGEQEESNSILSKVVVAFQQVSHTLNE